MLDSYIIQMYNIAVRSYKEVISMKRLPDAEFEVMKCIWANEPPVTTSDIMAQLGNERGWKTPALITLLQRLSERGFLRSEKPGKERLYYPLIAQEDYLRFETDSFLGRVHGGSISSLMSALTGGQRLSRADRDELMRWVQQQEDACAARDEER